jgi:hypothetical protein
VTDCAEILALVEKVSDFEATEAEKLAAIAHLEKCPSCRSHAEFLAFLTEESRSMPFPEPPESYWEHLPRKVLDRIDSESRRPSGFFHILLAPSMLRWGALGATLLVVTTVGVSVLREDTRTPVLAPVPPVAPVVEAPQAQAQVAAEPIVSPPMARDEAVPASLEKTQLESLPKAEERARLSADSSVSTPAAPAEAVGTLDSNEDVGTSLRRENVQVLESANRARPRAAAPAGLSRVVLEDCEALRREVDSLGDGPGSGDARFQLALCSLESHQREATEELRTRAIEDAEAFLAGESEGARAEEVRKKLRRIKPD